MQLAAKLVKAVSKPSKPDCMPLRVKTVFALRNVEDVFDRYRMFLVLGISLCSYLIQHFKRLFDVCLF